MYLKDFIYIFFNAGFNVGGLSFNMFTWSVLFDGHVLVPSYCYCYHFHFLPFEGCTAFSVYPMSSFSLHSMAKDIRTRKRSFWTLEVRIPMRPMFFFFFFFVIVLQLITLVVQFSHNTGNISPL